MESIARVLGFRTPAISSIIDIAQIITGRDFRLEGRTANKLGLAGLSIANMHDLARNGSVIKSELEEVM